jgi:hypothetical protein
MAIQDFTAGQVLTAAQMDALQANDYNQTVSNKVASYTLVAADKGTRVVMSNASATTITVNTSLFTAGDTLFIQNIGAGVCTITAGTATVTSASSLALAQWQGGTLYFTSASAAIFFPSDKTAAAAGLTVVKAETAFTAAAAVTADSVFSSSYTNYRILIMSTSAAGAPQMNFTLRASGTAATTNYNWNAFSVNGATLTGSSATAQAAWTGGLTTTAPSWWAIDLFNPQVAAQTNMLMTMSQNQFQSWLYWSNNTNATAYDGIGFAPASSTITGSYTIYGYGKSV